MLSGLLSGDLPPNFSGHTLDKATKAKLTLENYYNNLISQQRERRERMRRMEVFYSIILFGRKILFTQYKNIWLIFKNI